MLTGMDDNLFGPVVRDAHECVDQPRVQGHVVDQLLLDALNVISSFLAQVPELLCCESPKGTAANGNHLEDVCLAHIASKQADKRDA